MTVSGQVARFDLDQGGSFREAAERNLGPDSILIGRRGAASGRLALLQRSDVEDKDLLTCFTAWRNRHMNCFSSNFTASVERTAGWLENVMLADPNRVFFKILDHEDRLVGHFGAILRDGCLEYDNLIRGESVPFKDFIYRAELSLMQWLFDVTDTRYIRAICFSDNHKILQLQYRVGYRVVGRSGLRKIVKSGGQEIVWEHDGSEATEGRHYVHIRLDRKEFFERNASQLDNVSNRVPAQPVAGALAATG